MKRGIQEVNRNLCRCIPRRNYIYLVNYSNNVTKNKFNIHFSIKYCSEFQNFNYYYYYFFLNDKIDHF